MKDKKIKRLVDKLSAEYSDVTLFLHENDNNQLTMAGHCTTNSFLPEIAIRCILMHAEQEEIEPAIILMNIICSMADKGDIDREQFKNMCPFFLNIDKAIKEN